MQDRNQVHLKGRVVSVSASELVSALVSVSEPVLVLVLVSAQASGPPSASVSVQEQVWAPGWAWA